MKGRMMLFVGSISACQFSPIHLTPSAAAQTGVASVYSHESGSATASGQKLDREALPGLRRWPSMSANSALARSGVVNAQAP